MVTDLGLRLQHLKFERSLLQKDIAKDVGLPLRTYQCYEKAESHPTTLTIIKLCRYFNVSADYLLGLSDEPRPLQPASDG